MPPTMWLSAYKSNRPGMIYRSSIITGCKFGFLRANPDSIFKVHSLGCKNAALLWSLLPKSASLKAQYDSDGEVDGNSFQGYTNL